jgi:hypothetical protein
MSFSQDEVHHARGEHTPLSGVRANVDQEGMKLCSAQDAYGSEQR